MKHTNGPWQIQKLEENHHGYENWKTFAIRSPQNVCLAVIGDVDRYHEKDHEANAHLIAAAPDMLEALKAIDTFFVFFDNIVPPDMGNGAREALQQARAAIKRAEGRE